MTSLAASKERAACCGTCRHFRNDGAYLEAAFKGLASLSSAHGSVRGDDGLCLSHERYLGARSWCADFAPQRRFDEG